MIAQYKAVALAWADPTLSTFQKAGAAVTAFGAVASSLSGIQSLGTFDGGSGLGGTQKGTSSLSGGVPASGAYKLMAGETVLTAAQTDDLYDYMDMGSGGSGGAVNVTANYDFSNAVMSDKAWFQKELAASSNQVAALVVKAQSQYPRRNK